MVYFLGRDVNVALTTEHKLLGISVSRGKAYVNNVKMADVDAIAAGDDAIWDTTAAHGLTTGDPITINMDAEANTGPGGGTSVSTVYFARVTDADSLQISTSYDGAIAGTGLLANGDSASVGQTNITREITGTSDSTEPNTFIFNRSWPKYDSQDGIAEIIADGTTAAPLQYSSATDRNRLTDITGIDLTLGKVDEDIAYFGQRTPLKAEVKNECTLVVTMKKSDSRWEVLFNKARCGVVSYEDTTKAAVDIDSLTVLGTSALPAQGATELRQGANTTVQLPNQNFGYRIHLELKSGASGEILTLQNMCMTDYSVSLNVDGVTEETVTFYGYIEPKIDANSTGYTTLTTTSEL